MRLDASNVVRAVEEVEATLELDVTVAEEVVKAAAAVVTLLDVVVLEDDVADEVGVLVGVDSDDETADVVDGVTAVCVTAATVDVPLVAS
jgi:hypothetical protein